MEELHMLRDKKEYLSKYVKSILLKKNKLSKPVKPNYGNKRVKSICYLKFIN